MTEAQALTTSPTTPSIRNLLVKCKFLTMKAFGRYGNVVVYHIIEGRQGRGRKIAEPRPIICIVEVVEATQAILVKLNDNGTVLLMAKNGIGALQDKMSIFNPNTNDLLAEVTSAQAWDFFNPQDSLTLNYPHTFPKEPCIIRCVQRRLYFGCVHQCMKSSCADFANSTATGIQKVLAMMVMVTFYYTVYHFHLTPKPSAILGRLPASAPLTPTIHSLGNMASIILRPVCQTPTARYIEVLYVPTHLITLIIEQSAWTTKSFKLCFRDVFGTIIFTSERVGHVNYVRTDTGMLIGSHGRTSATDETTQFFDALTGTPIMTQQSGSLSQDTPRQITSTSYNNEVVAEITPLLKNILLGVTMTHNIPAEHKALILSSVGVTSLVYYNLFISPTPDMTAYPFRPSTKQP